MFAQRGLRRTQSMKSVKSIKGRKEASIILVEFVFQCILAFFVVQKFIFTFNLGEVVNNWVVEC